MDKPFIYIAALRRTGSTMLCEALTQAPHSIVFNEPNIMYRRFVVRKRESELLAQYDVDLDQFSRKWSGIRKRAMMRGFRTDLAVAVSRSFQQIGIKEIFHRKWKKVIRHFPNTRIVLTARDPRDIYLSLHSRFQAGNAIWRGPFDAKRVADSLNAEFRYQKEMTTQATTFNLRYEDLCQKPEIMDEIVHFVESDISEIGPLGEFLRSDKNRVDEGKLHDGVISQKRVSRWKQENDQALLDQAHEVMRLMPEYCEFWDYR